LLKINKTIFEIDDVDKNVGIELGLLTSLYYP